MRSGFARGPLSPESLAKVRVSDSALEVGRSPGPHFLMPTYAESRDTKKPSAAQFEHECIVDAGGIRLNPGEDPRLNRLQPEGFYADECSTILSLVVAVCH